MSDFQPEAEPPEIFDIPLLGKYYRYPLKKIGGRLVMVSPGRNSPCVCGSGRKLKKCCGEARPDRFEILVQTINEWFLKTDEDIRREEERARIARGPMRGSLATLFAIGALGGAQFDYRPPK
jgi:hypothetical protein